MRRLHFCLRLFAVAVAFPAILLYIAAATLMDMVISFRAKSGKPLRLWMGILDWTRGIPFGYSYWEQFEAPAMLDEIAVHHDD